MDSSALSTSAVNPLLNDDPFQNEESRKLFEAIDELRSCGANRDIELPELVIVGDQSAGKSSLLQSLTDIPFPVASRLCTRFPTRIVSRRTPGIPEATTVSIEDHFFSQFSEGKHNDSRARYDGFKRTVPTMTAKDFEKVVEDATDAMNIKRAISDETIAISPHRDGKRNFSDDVLKVEISGPDRSHFSILDVPGIFQSLMKGLTSKEKDGVRSMVESYIKPKQSVIICVVNGTNDPANQAVFDMVSRYDKDGKRTVGVITKCDIAEDIDKVIDLADNKEKKFSGWFVVRNRSRSEVEKGIGPMERFENEQDFFNKEPWLRLRDEGSTGTKALKGHLANLLSKRIKATFPTFLEEIQRLQSFAQSELLSLGKARKTLVQKRSYLTGIAAQIHDIALQSLRGRYDSTTADGKKLRKIIRDLNDKFVLDMKMNGHSVPFVVQHVPFVAPHVGADWGKPVVTATNQPKTSNGPGFGGPNLADVGSPCLGTTSIPFQPQQSKEPTERIICIWQSIPFMAAYKGFSFEELRLSDYLQNPSISSTPNDGRGFGGFGSSVQAKPATSLFGQSSQPTQPRQGSPAFGASSQPEQSSHSGLFGGSPLFGAQTSPKPYTSVADTAHQVQSQEIYRWIRDEIKACRGTELQGTLNPDVLPTLFHKQARNWRGIAELYFHAVLQTIFTALVQILHSVCADPLTRKRIEDLLREANQESKKRGSAQLTSRLNEILSRHLQTSNPAFEQKVSEARRLRFQAALARYKSSRPSATSQLSTNGTAAEKTAQPTDDLLVIDMRDTESLFAQLHFSNSQNLEDEVHDTLKAYYEIAREDFVGYVNDHIVEQYLYDAHGPVLLFDSVYVAGLNDEKIEALAVEDETLVQKRAEKEEALSRLSRAEEIAQRYQS